MKLILYIVCLLSIIGTLAPLSDNRFWLIRTQSNIKAYYLALNVILLLVMLLWHKNSVFELGIILLLGLSIVKCVIAIYPYTSVAPKSVPSVVNADRDRQLSIIIYNVLQKNDKYQKFLDLVNIVDPDIILAIEVNDKWYNNIDSLKSSHPHIIKETRDNTYGIAMYSKIPYQSAKVNHLVKDDVPSLEAIIEFNGDMIRLTGVHPEPPIPGEVLTSGPKDLELLRIARHINDNQSSDYDIVIGDLNDVGWSKNSTAFKEISGLRDPREGRGFYPTFPTYLPIRIPLDQVFCSEGLSLVKFETLRNIGSDHFPISVIFQTEEDSEAKDK